MQLKVYKGEGYRIHTIKTDKFKNCSVEIMFRDKLNKDNITANNVLVDVLCYGSSKYPKRRDIAIELENLYASSFRGFVTRLGDSSITSFILDFLNPKYCDEGFLNEILSFPFELINNPNIINDEFDNRSFNIVKNRIKSDIESLKENATRYSFRRGLYNMDPDSPSSYFMVGYMDQLDAITPSSLVKTYKELINETICDIYVVGDMDMDEVAAIIKKNFKRKNVSKDIPLYVDNKKRKKHIDVLETGQYEQDSFVMIYNLEKMTPDEINFDFQLYNIIFGCGGLTSKLYQALREKNSLCYSVSSMYQKYDRLLIIYAGINKKDKDKCVKLVENAINEMKNGDFSIEELENAKLTAISSIKMSEDSQGGIINNYLFNDLDNLPLYDERIEKFKNVTKEDVVRVAKNLSLNTIYLLSGEDK